MWKTRYSNICWCHWAIEERLTDIQNISFVKVKYDDESFESCISEIERLESILDDIHRLVDFTELNEAISMWQRMEAGLIRRKEIMVENWLE